MKVVTVKMVKDDELPCVIGGEDEGICIWRVSRSSVGSSDREKLFMSPLAI